MGLTLEMGTYCFLGCNAQHDHSLWTWHVFSKTVSHMQLILNVSATSSKPIEIFFDKTQSAQALEKQETWNSPIWQYTTSRPTTKGNEITIGRRISSGLRKSWPGNRGVKWGGRVGFGVSESYSLRAKGTRLRTLKSSSKCSYTHHKAHCPKLIFLWRFSIVCSTEQIYEFYEEGVSVGSHCWGSVFERISVVSPVNIQNKDLTSSTLRTVKPTLKKIYASRENEADERHWK